MQAKMILVAALAAVQVEAVFSDTFQMASEQLLDIFRTKQNVSVEPQQIVEEVVEELEKEESEDPLKFYLNQYPKPCETDKLQTIADGSTMPFIITSGVWSDSDTWDSFRDVLNTSDDFPKAQMFT
jgi:hypothetical protein